MNSVAEILSRGKSFRSDETFDTSDATVALTESVVGRKLPPQYCEFLTLDGLCELAFEHRILPPTAIADSFPLVASHKIVPFASNGCGDLFCWDQFDVPVFWDHETDTTSPAFGTFLEALEAWRRP